MIQHSEYSIYQSVSAYIKVYPNFTKLIKYDEPITVRSAGFEERDPKPKTNKKSMGGISAVDSLRRTKTTISDLVLCNDFDMFATFTFKSDRFDMQKSKQKMSNWFDSQKKQYGHFDHLIVGEFHKNCEDCAKIHAKTCPHKDKPKALHFHVLLKNYKGVLTLAPVKINGRQTYNIESYKGGYSTVVIIDNKEKVSSYIKKYIIKDMPMFAGKKRFWSSKNLKRPLKLPVYNITENIMSGYVEKWKTDGLTVYEKPRIIAPTTTNERVSPHGRHKTVIRESEHRRSVDSSQHHARQLQKRKRGSHHLQPRASGL